jgi:hypothetical protein
VPLNWRENETEEEEAGKLLFEISICLNFASE